MVDQTPLDLTYTYIEPCWISPAGLNVADDSAGRAMPSPRSHDGCGVEPLVDLRVLARNKVSAGRQ
jgi:hypothetical protein